MHTVIPSNSWILNRRFEIHTVFDPWWFESTNAKTTDTEGQLYIY